jgi:hypothetical protein
MSAVGSSSVGSHARDDLAEFYETVFDVNPLERHVGTVPPSVEVEDIESTLTRVWDFGGTIVSTVDSDRVDGSLAAATFRDPVGRLISIYTATR